MLVTITVLTYNRKHILKNLLEDLRKIRYQDLEIIIVDNCSSDGTHEMILKQFSDFIYIVMDKNLGVSARNEGLKRAKGDIIITLDDDVFGIDDSAIDNLVEYFGQKTNVGALNFSITDSFSGKICNWIHHREVEVYSSEEFITYEISEGAVAFQKEALNASGFYPDYFFLSHEGPDLAFRILNSGFEVRYSPMVKVLHSHAQEGRKSWFRYYFDTRNQFYLAMRNFPPWYATKYLIKSSLSTLFYSLRDGFLGYWIKGVYDGICGMVTYSGDRKILSKKTMKVIYEVDKNRPSLIYMVKKRIFRNEMRL
ncbi:glycosyltransferase family 2 protein [Desulfosediminicola sp.]|uniref:glycosyltransferase family 2 protein n=1 Tax=Desulfosediminicola sp. TaxID=2886825 RepID=UPI003AF242E5